MLFVSISICVTFFSYLGWSINYVTFELRNFLHFPWIFKIFPLSNKIKSKLSPHVINEDTPYLVFMYKQFSIHELFDSIRKSMFNEMWRVKWRKQKILNWKLRFVGACRRQETGILIWKSFPFRVFRLHGLDHNQTNSTDF